MKSRLRKRINYLLYVLVVFIIILIGFNIYFTYQIHYQLGNIVKNPGRWPADAYVFDHGIGFDFSAGVSDYISDGSFYVKSHQLGYRIGQDESASSFEPGGIMSLGCSFTYGDQVDSKQTFTQILADSLGMDAYNFGISSFSYTHALLKARKLKDNGILEKLKPSIVVLGCWKGLLDRSRAPVPPIARSIPLVAAHLVKDDGGVHIHPPENFESAFEMIRLYRKEGTEMTPGKFIKLFFMAPGYVRLFLSTGQGKKMAAKGVAESDVSDLEIYDFYFTAIENTFSSFGSRILVLYMPLNSFDVPDQALIDALRLHPEIILIDGQQALRKYGVDESQYEGKHPQPEAHKAFAWGISSALSQ